MKKALAFLLTLSIFTLCSCSNTNVSLTIPQISTHFDNSLYEEQKVIINDSNFNEDVDVLSDLLLLDQWKMMDKTEDGTLLMTIYLSELYEIYIYDSHAKVYYGYASWNEDEYAYYSVPSEVIENIEAYIETTSEK